MHQNNVKISLILCTLGRIEEVKTFLEHAKHFTFTNFEIIIADQNNDNRIENIINLIGETPYKIIHLKTPIGLSRSRNTCIPYAQGQIIAFPDDDCLYEKNTLEKVDFFFKEYEDTKILITKWVNPDINGFQPHKNIKSHFIKNPKEIFSFMSSGIFVQKNVFKDIKCFDENIGLGSGTIFKGGEDCDFLIRCFNHSYKIYYSSGIIFYHPWKGIDKYSSKNIIKKYLKDIEYSGASDIYVIIKNFSKIKSIRIILNNILMMLLLFLIRNSLNAKIHYHRVKGFIKGYLAIKKYNYNL